jgi:PAS domain S-box-containing protein
MAWHQNRGRKLNSKKQQKRAILLIIGAFIAFALTLLFMDSIFEFLWFNQGKRSFLEILLGCKDPQKNLTRLMHLSSITLVGFLVAYAVKIILISQYKIQKSEKNLKVTLNSIGDAVITTSKELEVLRMNPIAEQLTGWEISEAKNKAISEIFKIYDSRTKEEIKAPVEKSIATKETIILPNNILLISKSKQEYHISSSASPIQDKDGNIIGTILIFRDISDIYQQEKKTKELENKLNQSRKLDAIGQLAGGVAHDFNNMLGGILGAAQILKLTNPDLKKESNEFIDIIINASERAANLTSQLLAFSRRGKIASTNIDISKIIKDTLSILTQTLDKKITITNSQQATNFTIVGNDSEIQNALINLGINASHAMPEGGSLSFTTRNIELNHVYCKESAFEIEPGDFIEIEVRDTGCGISPQNISKIFEPFFTTKEQGKGTGLGLSAVYGTIKKHHGAIKVYSEVGTGTVFHIYLPNSISDSQKLPAAPDETLAIGKGNVLLVDDEDIIRVTGSFMLKKMGYTVIAAKNGEEAIEIFKSKHKQIDLVISDMIMPKMNGRETFYKMKEIDPDCKIIISSGFTKDENLKDMKKDGLAGFIDKPFRAIELNRLLNQILPSEKEISNKTLQEEN